MLLCAVLSFLLTHYYHIINIFTLQVPKEANANISPQRARVSSLPLHGHLTVFLICYCIYWNLSTHHISIFIGIPWMPKQPWYRFHRDGMTERQLQLKMFSRIAGNKDMIKRNGKSMSPQQCNILIPSPPCVQNSQQYKLLTEYGTILCSSFIFLPATTRVHTFHLHEYFNGQSPCK